MSQAKKSSETPVNERRLSARASRVVAIEHRLLFRNTKKAETSWSLSTTRNMSFTGLLFLSSVPYKIGDLVDVSVVISGVIDIVKGPAEVVRVIENGDTSFDIAVRFLLEKTKSRSAKKHR